MIKACSFMERGIKKSAITNDSIIALVFFEANRLSKMFRNGHHLFLSWCWISFDTPNYCLSTVNEQKLTNDVQLWVILRTIYCRWFRMSIKWVLR